MKDPQHDHQSPEHQRYARHLQALDAVPDAGGAELIAAVLRPEDTQMAQSVAVVHHMNHRAAHLLTDVRSTAWAHFTATVIEHRGFLTRRLREWELLRAIALRDRGPPSGFSRQPTGASARP